MDQRDKSVKKAVGSPIKSSTPSTKCTVRHRAGIHDMDTTVESPIQHNKSKSPRMFIQTRSRSRISNQSESEDDDDDEDDPENNYEIMGGGGCIPECVNISGKYNRSRLSAPRSRDNSRNRIKTRSRDNSQCNHPKDKRQVPIIICFLIALGAIVAFFFNNVIDTSESDNPEIIIRAEPKFSLEDIKESFASQSEVLWDALESGVNDVKQFETPKTFIFLHESNAESTADKLLHDVSKKVISFLQDAKFVEPLTLNIKDLSSREALNDYGYLIEKYAPELEYKTVMIVKNLDLVPSTSAQAFHSFCDEYTPVVKKSVFFFTMKSRKFNGTDFQYVESVLRHNWRDLNSEVFDPLMSRLSSMFLHILK